MKPNVRKTFVFALLAAFVLAMCAPPAVPTPERIVETQVVTVVETQIVNQTQVVEQEVEVVITATPAPVSGEVTVMLIGKPVEDTLDPITGAEQPGVAQLEAMFEEAYPSIDLTILNIDWGSGSTSYSAKTESMIQAQEACVYHMPGAFAYGSRGYLENLDPWMANDPTFEDVWAGDNLEQWRGWGPGNPDNQWAVPYTGGNRVIHWDAVLFEQWGVEPLSLHPTLEEIEEKAAAMTGINPVTGEQNYGYWYQGKYLNWQFQAIAHALGANWGQVNADGSWSIDWNTPEYLAGAEWLLKMSKYAPPGALAADVMPEGFLTDQNVVAIIPEGETGYYLSPFVAQPELQERFRTTYNVVGPDGKGGLFIADPLAMATACPNKPAAWEAMKWLAGSPESQKYNFDAGGNLPVIEGAENVIPELGSLKDAEPILYQNGIAERRYPWASSEPRFALQAALEAMLAGTMSPAEALEQAQGETEAWLAAQAAGE
jgi:hypothetical protein